MGCGGFGRDSATDSDAIIEGETDSESTVVEVTPTEYEQANLGGYVFHQIVVSEGGVVGTFTYALFQDPAPTRVPLTSVRAEHCRVDDKSSLFAGTRDVGSSVMLEVGSDSLRLTKDPTWPGEIAYVREFDGMAPPGTTPGGTVSFQGTNTGVSVPSSIPTMPDTSFWPELIDTGNMHLRWTPTGADHVQVGVLSYQGPESGPAFVCSLEDDGDAVIETGMNFAGWSAVASFMPVNRGRVIVPDIGEVEVVVAIPIPMHYSPPE